MSSQKSSHLYFEFNFSLMDEKILRCKGFALSLDNPSTVEEKDLKEKEFPLVEFDVSGLEPIHVERIQNRYATQCCLKHLGFKLEQAPKKTGLVGVDGNKI